MSSKEYQQEYYKKNKERLNEYRKQWAKDHQDTIKAKQKERLQTDEEYSIQLTKYKAEWHLQNRWKNPEKYMWNRSRNGARARNIEFSIELDDIQIPTHCPILGIPFSYDSENTAPSLDRKDSTQ